MTERFITYRSALLWALAAALPGAAVGLHVFYLQGPLSHQELEEALVFCFVVVFFSSPFVCLACLLHAALFNSLYSSGSPAKRLLLLSPLVGGVFCGAAAGAFGYLLFVSPWFAGEPARFMRSLDEELAKDVAAAGVVGGVLYGGASALYALWSRPGHG